MPGLTDFLIDEYDSLLGRTDSASSQSPQSQKASAVPLGILNVIVHPHHYKAIIAVAGVMLAPATVRYQQRHHVLGILPSRSSSYDCRPHQRRCRRLESGCDSNLLPAVGSHWKKDMPSFVHRRNGHERFCSRFWDSLQSEDPISYRYSSLCCQFRRWARSCSVRPFYGTRGT